MARTCIGCRGAGERGELIRLVLADDGEVFVDLSASAVGRGAWVHPRAECIAEAASRGLPRAFRGPVRADREALLRAVVDAAGRRVLALVGSARAAGRLAIGSDAVHEALERGTCRLLMVAADGRASVSSLPTGAAGSAVVWGDKQSLGAALGRGATAVVGVLDDGLASAIARAIALSTLSAPASRGEAGSRPVQLEVR